MPHPSFELAARFYIIFVVGYQVQFNHSWLAASSIIFVSILLECGVSLASYP